LAVISLRLFHIIPFLPVGASEKFPPTSIAVDLFARGGCECMCCVLQREREQNAGRNIEAERASERLFGSELRERV